MDVAKSSQGTIIPISLHAHQPETCRAEPIPPYFLLKGESMKHLTFNEWVEKYRPITISGEPEVFETFGDDLNVIRNTNKSNVWTVTEEDGVSIIQSGMKFVNRLYFLVTSFPYKGEVQVSMGTEAQDSA